tara:strand:+ start:1832 stop:2260 length:429 start_codon:yes stop_codon:yes gene_type:complete
MSVDEELDAVIESRNVEPETETVDVMVGKSLWTLKFQELDGLDWANVIALNPLRPGVNIDRQFGYDYDGAAMTAAPLSGVRVTADGTEALSSEQWKKLFKTLAGHDFTKVANAVWALNEINPMRRLAKAKKALADVSAKSSS